MPEIVDVEIRADTSAFDQALKDLESRSKQFGSVLTNALKSAVVSGKGLEDVLRGVALSLGRHGAGCGAEAAARPAVQCVFRASRRHSAVCQRRRHAVCLRRRCLFADLFSQAAKASA